MDPTQSRHLARVRHIRERFAEANERLVARLREATDEAAGRAQGGRWTASQIGWHVAAVTNRFAALLTGDAPGAGALPAGFVEREWDAIAAAIPERLEASPAVAPPPVVSRHDAIAALEGSGVRLARALDTVTAERGGRWGLTHPLVGVISLYQVGEWAAAHAARHERQASHALGAESGQDAR